MIIVVTLAISKFRYILIAYQNDRANVLCLPVSDIPRSFILGTYA
jgi:hypothetical protein